MQSNQVRDVVETLLTDTSNSQLSDMAGKLDQILRLMDDATHLQRVALLEEGHILRFHAGALTQVALSLPDAQDDFLQRFILRRRNFFEAKLLTAIQAMKIIGPGTTVCDIGANIGNHSVFFGKVLGAKRVLAFEPQPHSYGTLCRNLELNGLTDALAYNCMVGGKSGRGTVTRFNPRNLAATAFAAAKDGEVPMVALDDLMDAEEMQGLGFIKIDVEGMQMDVLSGAKKVIKAFKPVVWLDLDEKSPVLAEATKAMTTLGYGSERIGPNNFLFTSKK